MKSKMVDDVTRKADETSTVENCVSASGNPSLKLRINLRDRQSIRKRPRSSSPSSDSSSRSSGRNSNNGAVVSQLAVQQPEKTVSKRNRTRTAPEIEEVILSQDTPPPSNASAVSPNKSDDRLDAKEDTEESNSSTQNGNNKVLLVDMEEDGDKPSTSLAESSADAVTDAAGNPLGKAAQLIKRLSRDELERLVMEQMCLVIREKGMTGVLERKLELADAQIERCKKRSDSLQKQLTDLEQVVRRFVQQNKGRLPLMPPTKLTRSVGLQINASNPIVTVHAVNNKLTPKPEQTSPVKPSVSVVTTNKTVITSPPVQKCPFIPVPPSFTTTATSDIASYVPRQAQPRYQTHHRRSDEVILTAGPVHSPTKTVNYTTNKGTINISPVKQMIHNNNGRVKVLESPIGQSPQSPMARWAKVPVPRAHPNQQTTVVNKVMLPSRVPSAVIDLTEEEEKGRIAAAAAVTNGRNGTKQPIPVKSNQTTFVNGQLSTAGPQRGVALKSTSLNGRPPLSASRASNTSNTKEHQVKIPLTHPAPLPPAPVNAVNPAWKPLPSKPTLEIKRVSNGIVLSWNMLGPPYHADIASYQLFAYQEGSDPPTVNGSVWKRVGDVKALPLPMACTLTQFLEGHRYHFAVRAMDVHGRAGPYSEPGTILLS